MGLLCHLYLLCFVRDRWLWGLTDDFAFVLRDKFVNGS
jgi:hypothetical protein